LEGGQDVGVTQVPVALVQAQNLFRVGDCSLEIALFRVGHIVGLSAFSAQQLGQYRKLNGGDGGKEVQKRFKLAVNA
jgi:hypothetical protein